VRFFIDSLSVKALQICLALSMVSPAVCTAALAEDDGSFGVALTFFRMGDYAQAVKFLKAAERTSGSYDPRILYYEGVCYHRSGHFQEARACYQKVIQTFPDTDAAELAKKGIGVIDFGSGLDKPGGSLAKIKNLRMDVVPPAVSIHCLEKDGKPLVDVIVDGKKIPFVLDVTAPTTSLGLEIVRANGLNDMPPGKKTPIKPLQKIEKYEKVEVKTEKVGKSEITEKTTTKTEVTHPLSDTELAKAASNEQAKDDAKMKTVDVPAADPKGGVDPNQSEIVLYDVSLGPVQRPSFPVAISTTKPKAAVLGRDFLNVYKVTFDITGKTLTMVRDHSYENPFASGMALLNKGKYKQAVPLLKRASENRPGDFRALYCYGLAMQQSGNLEGAKAVYRSVVKRFPNTEAQYMSTVALMAIDPAFAADAHKASAAASGSVAEVKKVSPYFDVPYSTEGSNMKVSVYINTKPVDMIVDWNGTEFVFNSPQLAAIDPTALADLQEVSRSVDDSTGNNMVTTVTKKGFLKSVRLGQAERRNVAVTVTDMGIARLEYSWNGSNALGVSYRPLFPIKTFTEWNLEVMADKKVIRFTKK
jgi:tetratricopeptide (TPR) repeat protein